MKTMVLRQVVGDVERAAEKSTGYEDGSVSN